MILTRTPFRISFAGGGSDIEKFYTQHEGCVLSTAINKYMYISINPNFNISKTIIKYSKVEDVECVQNISHPVVKQILCDASLSGIELDSIADVLSGTGLASSSAFTVGLLNAVNTYKGITKTQEELAHDACEVEINKLKEPIGKQDQYGCAVGGLKFIKFLKDGSVKVEPIILQSDTLNKLNNNLLMFYVGGTHNANEILKVQTQNISEENKFNNLIKMTELAYELKDVLLSNNIETFGSILHKGWLLKRELANGITNPVIDKYYNIAMNNGASGGKLLGAGGAGFLLFYCEEKNQAQLKYALSNLRELDFNFDMTGTTVVFNDKRN